MHTWDPSRTREGGGYRKIRSSSSSSYPLQSQPELHEASSPKDEKKLCPHETCFPITWLSLGRNEQASAHIRESLRAQMTQRQLCHWRTTPAGAGAQYCCTPEAPCLSTTQLAECPPSGLASFDCFQKGIFPVFFHYKFPDCEAALAIQSLGTHGAYHIFRAQTHYHIVANGPERHNSFMAEPPKELPASCRAELGLSFLLRRLFHCIE